jgi:acetylornithine deacetylase/succinyl-diaminopimelate desuccinylase-like protein
MAKVDFRIVPNQKVDKVQKMLREHLDKHGFTDIETMLLTGYEPAKTPVDHPFIQLLAKTTKNFSNKEPLLIPSSPGSGPAYLFGPYTPWAMCETFDPEKNIHAPNESIRLNDLKHMTAFIAAITTKLGKT